MPSKSERRAARKAESLAKQQRRAASANPGQKRVPTILGEIHEDMGTILWSVALFDDYEPWRCSDSDSFREIVGYFREFENRTWADVQQDGENNHESPKDKLIKEARDRLEELKLDDVDGLWSFHFKGRWRLWGIRDRRVFQVLWWDPEHQVYPSKKKHT